MQYTLWEDQLPQRIRKKKAVPLTSVQPYSITGGNDCAILGHTLRAWDLAGCTICLDCGVNVYCPGCITAHTQDKQAIAVLCSRHQESQVQQ